MSLRSCQLEQADMAEEHCMFLTKDWSDQLKQAYRNLA